VFVDGAHDKASVIRDMSYALAFKPAVLAVHDFGLFEVIEGVRASGLDREPDRVVNTLAVFVLGN
jgi:hypothetical protein